MYVVIAGAGVAGFHIASLLAEGGQEVVVIEESVEALENVRRQLDVKTVLGNAATPGALREAEVHRADLIVAVTDSDETNMLTCFMAKESHVGRAAARIRNPDYAGYFVTGAKSPSAPRRVIRPKSLGIDLIINPDFEAAREMVDTFSSFYPAPTANFVNGRVQIKDFRVGGREMVNRPLGEIEFPKPCVVATITRAGQTIMPAADELLKQDDHIHLLASREFMDEFGRMFAQSQRPARSVVILGGGRVGSLVAESLGGRGISVKIIEEDLNRCQEIAARLEQVMVLQGDGADRDFLIEQGVPSANAFVAATDGDELNILCSLLAKSLGVPRGLALVNKPGYIPLAEVVGIDLAVSPLLLIAARIAHFVLHGGVISAAFIAGMELQAIEFVVSATAHIAQRKITQAGLPKEAIVGAIIRDGTVIIPPDDSIIQSDDHVIVVSPVSVTSSGEKLFK